MNEETKNNNKDNFQYQTISNPSNNSVDIIEQNLNDTISNNNLNIFNNNRRIQVNSIFRLNKNKKHFLIYLLSILCIDLIFYFNYKITRYNYTNYNLFTFIDPFIICKQYYDIFNECVYNETYLINKNITDESDSDSFNEFDSSSDSNETFVIDPNICKKEGNNFISCNEKSLNFMKNYQPYISKYRRCKKEHKKCSMILNDIKTFLKDYKIINSTILINNL